MIFSTPRTTSVPFSAPMNFKLGHHLWVMPNTIPNKLALAMSKSTYLALANLWCFGKINLKSKRIIFWANLGMQAQNQIKGVISPY